ncbi:Uncharacterised protein [Bordetella pertussis]|nr:Uncharacterised protein [Bordetella pertussis]
MAIRRASGLLAAQRWQQASAILNWVGTSQRKVWYSASYWSFMALWSELGGNDGMGGVARSRLPQLQA